MKSQGNDKVEAALKKFIWDIMSHHLRSQDSLRELARIRSQVHSSFYEVDEFPSSLRMKEFYSGDKILSKKPPYYRTAEVPDVPDIWFSPELVWEIRGADFIVSPVHYAAIGLVHPSHGISVRFPRFIRSLSDRKPEECSTATDIVEMFHSQTRKMDVSVEV